MAVFRVEKNKGYTVMSNHHLRNKELTLKAKGLLSQMLSLPENWDYVLSVFSITEKLMLSFQVFFYTFLFFSSNLHFTFISQYHYQFVNTSTTWNYCIYNS